MKRIPIKKFLLILLGIWLTGISGCGETQVKVLISPRTVTIPRDQQFQFTVEVIDTQDTSVTWCVLNTAGACAASTDLSRGTINPTTGLYTPPATIPTPNTVTIRVTSNADPSVTDSAVVTLVSGNTLKFGENFLITTRPGEPAIPATTTVSTLSSGQHSIKLFHNTAGSIDNTFVYTVWSDNRNGATTYDVFFRQITITVDTSTSTETTVYSAAVKINTVSSADLADPSMTVDGSGNVYVAWSSGSSSDHDIYVLKGTFSDAATSNLNVSFGTTITPVRFDDGGTFDQRAPSIATDGTNVYVAWQDKRSGNFDIHAAVGLPTATAPPTSFPLNNTTTPGNQTEPSVAWFGGSLYVTWTDDQSNNNTIYFTKVALSSTSATWATNVRVNDDTSGSSGLCYTKADGTKTAFCYSDTATQRSPSLTVDTAGNIYVVWEDNRDPLNLSTPMTPKTNSDIYFAKSTDGGLNFDAVTVIYTTVSGTDTLTLTEHNIRVNDDTLANGFLDNADQLRPSIAVEKPEPNATSTTPDKIYIAWQDNRWGGVGKDDIITTKSLDGGNTFWTNSQPADHDPTKRPTSNPSITVDDFGRAYLIWTGMSGSGSDVFFAIGQ